MIDALFGTGFHGAPRPEAAALIERINACGLPVVAVDLPPASTPRPARSRAPPSTRRSPSRSRRARSVSTSRRAASTPARSSSPTSGSAERDGRPSPRHPGAAAAGAAPRRARLQVHAPAPCSSSAARPGRRARRCSTRDGRAARRRRLRRRSPSRASACAVVEALALEPVKRGFDWDDAEDAIMAEAASAPTRSRSGRASAAAPRRTRSWRALLERLELPVVVDADALFGLQPLLACTSDRADAACRRARAAARPRLGVGRRPPARGRAERRRAVRRRRPAEGRRHDRAGARRRARRLRHGPARRSRPRARATC